jgi:hypothetical protein
MVVMQLPQWLARFNRYVTGLWKPIFARLPVDEAVLLRRT